MTTAELQALIRSLQEFRTDLLHVEAKRSETELPKRLWETLSAFSNTPGGGVLILGLDGAAGFGMTGVRDPKQVMQDIASECDKMDPPVRAPIEPHQVEGATLVVAEMPEAQIGRGEIVALLRQRGELSRADVAQRLGVSDETAGRWLGRLRAERSVELTTRSSRDPNAKYRLIGVGHEGTSS